MRADYVVTSKNGYDTFTSSAGDALASAPGVAAASAVRDDKASSFGSDIDVTGVEPSTIGNVYDFRWEKGSDNVLLSLGFDGAIVRNQFADDHNLKVGSEFTIQTPQGKKTPLVVRGIYEPPAEELDALLGAVTLAQRAFDTHFPRPKDLFVFVDTDDGATPQATAALNKTLEPVSRRGGCTPTALGRRAGRQHRHDPEHLLRAARAVDHREPVRDGERAGAVGVRAHA